MRKRLVHVVMKWGDTIDSIWTSKTKAQARVDELSYSWKVSLQSVEVK